jgi:mRNA-degrading endonuclease toxin of MazEF toxin-antitoxin module
MLKQGSVVRANVVDPQGGNAKIRSLVIVTATDEIDASGPFVAVAITGKFSDPLASDEAPLPYHPAGKASSGLRKPSVAKCSWLVGLQLADVVDVKGYLSNDRVSAILECIAALPKLPPEAE